MPGRSPRKKSPGASPGTRPGVAKDARTLTQNCLERVLLQGAELQSALDGLLRASALPPRDAALATELCYGYLRGKLRCDFLVERHLQKPKGVPPALRILLGQCAYALASLERVPAYATVDWGAGAARKRFGTGLSRLTNAVLRRVAQDVDADAREPEFYRLPRDTEIDFLSRLYSCPLWIVGRWQEAYGQETTLAWLQAQAEAPPVGLRLNPGHEEHDTLAARIEALPGCLQASPPGYALQATSALPELEALERSGALSRQSLASFQALQQLGALDPDDSGWPEPIWDACCGHGGKSCALLEAGKHVWCSDRSRRRLRGLQRELVRLQLPAAPLFLADATQPPLQGRPRTILLDAPCSGLGVISRRPDAKWRRSEADVRELARLQARLLDAAADLLPLGGRLCYLTCTLMPEENEGQVARLLAARPEMQLIRQWHTPPDSLLREFFFGVVLEKQR